MSKLDPPKKSLPEIPSDQFRLLPTTLPPPPPPPIYDPGQKIKFIPPSHWMKSKQQKNTKNKKIRDAYDFGQVLSTDLQKKRVANYSDRDQGLGSSNPAMKLKARPLEKIANIKRDKKAFKFAVLDNTPLLPPRPDKKKGKNKKEGPAIPPRPITNIKRDKKSGHQTVLDNTPLLPPKPDKKKGPTIPKRPLIHYFGGKKSLKKRKKRKRVGKSPKRRTKKRKGRRTKKRKSRKKRKRKTRRR